MILFWYWFDSPEVWQNLRYKTRNLEQECLCEKSYRSSDTLLSCTPTIYHHFKNLNVYYQTYIYTARKEKPRKIHIWKKGHACANIDVLQQKFLNIKITSLPGLLRNRSLNFFKVLEIILSTKPVTRTSLQLLQCGIYLFINLETCFSLFSDLLPSFAFCTWQYFLHGTRSHLKCCFSTKQFSRQSSRQLYIKTQFS